MAKEFFVKRYWKMLKRPVSVAFGLILLFGFGAGIIFWGGLHTGLEMTNTEEFCIGCHEMRDNVYEEYKTTVHYSNASGVRAECSDCHVPQEWGPKMVRKIQASKELWGKIAGTIDTREKFLDHRLEMASREWARMKENDSQECRNCHNFEFMDYSMQSNRAMDIHYQAQKNGDTCIDCHKGIAHELPDMSGVADWEG
ncbi:NapC/NirT family cytochrome c [Parendozoicomonas haliclonae]|uniref:Cytochrome c-type protein n=1 Tax=Parendozoicomonas haliclonae TaxID=1960125 RepID=A0A1X7AEP6_9GAMM|nr:NapC/NirT family cytochrome c [Parendozoicomonas haliclonae]SMA35080.1 Cytochrome c-type protein NapC [Parendozoicomonas haliclonae]